MSKVSKTYLRQRHLRPDRERDRRLQDAYWAVGYVWVERVRGYVRESSKGRANGGVCGGKCEVATKFMELSPGSLCQSAMGGGAASAETTTLANRSVLYASPQGTCRAERSPVNGHEKQQNVVAHKLDRRRLSHAQCQVTLLSHRADFRPPAQVTARAFRRAQRSRESLTRPTARTRRPRGWEIKNGVSGRWRKLHNPCGHRGERRTANWAS